MEKNILFFANTRNVGCGIEMLKEIAPNSARIAFFDPQYRGVLDKLSYGNEGARQKGRAALDQMDEDLIVKFISMIDSALKPSGYLFLWIDKFHLCQGFQTWLENTSLEIVDMIVWNKGRIGMGYRSRRKSEYLVVIQKAPKRAKGTWSRHNIPDVWDEKAVRGGHPHQKPIELQLALIEATTGPGDIIIDPASGSFSVLVAANSVGNRTFIGTDICDHSQAMPETASPCADMSDDITKTSHLDRPTIDAAV